MFRLAAAGRPLHHDFASKAAAVDGEITDVIANMPLVRAFGGVAARAPPLRRDRRARDGRAATEPVLSRALRILHAVVTIFLALGLLAWAILLWQHGAATTGDVVLACTLGISVLQATRDLAVALVDITQHIARLSEALATLLVPHELRDHPEAAPLVRRGASVKFEHVHFRYGEGPRIFEDFNLSFMPGERVGLVGPSGGGKSTLFALLQRFYDAQGGRILIDGQDISRVTQESLREAIARRAAGHLAVPPLGHGEHPLRPARRHRRRSAARRRSPRAAISSRACRRACAPSSATAASNCPAASASASPSRALS